MMAIAGVIIAALIGGVTSLISADMQADTLEESQNEALGLAEKRRTDELAKTKESNLLTREALGQSRSQFLKTLASNREDSALNRAERKEQTAYNRKQDVYQNALATINNNAALRERASSWWGGKR